MLKDYGEAHKGIVYVFATNYDFLIRISLQPNVLNLKTMIKYLKFKISQVYNIRLQRYMD